MNEECINEFKERNPDYKKQIINKILFPNNDFNLNSKLKNLLMVCTKLLWLTISKISIRLHNKKTP